MLTDTLEKIEVSLCMAKESLSMGRLFASKEQLKKMNDTVHDLTAQLSPYLCRVRIDTDKKGNPINRKPYFNTYAAQIEAIEDNGNIHFSIYHDQVEGERFMGSPQAWGYGHHEQVQRERTFLLDRYHSNYHSGFYLELIALSKKIDADNIGVYEIDDHIGWEIFRCMPDSFVLESVLYEAISDCNEKIICLKKSLEQNYLSESDAALRKDIDSFLSGLSTFFDVFNANEMSDFSFEMEI